MTRIDRLLAAGRTCSFEFFPPKDAEEHARLVRTLRALEVLRPSFVSVTYRGGRASRERTVDLVTGMLRTTSLTPMAHLVCAGHSRLELVEILLQLRRAGVENLMALAGDPDFEPGELRRAVELVDLARAVGGFSIGVAAHPAGHPRSRSLRQDRRHLATKLRRADFAITQFFFDLDDYRRLLDDLAALGVDKPVLPGVMPVTSVAMAERMAKMGVAAPAALLERLRSAGEGARAVGIEAATDLCAALLDAGAPGLHFYTLNRSGATREIYRRLGLPGADVAVPGDDLPDETPGETRGER